MRALLLLCAASCAAGHDILGIDWGSSSFKAAALKADEFSIVLNDATKRKTASAIGFDGNERNFGDAAAALRGRLPLNVSVNYHQLLGHSTGSKTAKRLRSSPLMPFGTSEAPNGAQAVLTEDGNKYGPEELMGMSLYFAGQMTTAYVKSNISSCVVAVPPHFTSSARRAIVQAGEIAGVAVRTVVNDHAALAVQYAKERKWPADTGKVGAPYRGACDYDLVCAAGSGSIRRCWC